MKSFSLILIILASVSACLSVNVDILINDRPEIYISDTELPQLDGRIVGGSPVNISSHPHQISLQNFHSHSCGGSLIAPNWILTAAHCLSGGIHRYHFRLGTHLWAEGGILLSASEIISHPLYSSSTIDYDVGLVKLSVFQPEIPGQIEYVQLPPAGWEPMPGATAVVTGWGTPFSGGSLMAELQEVAVPIVSNESCEEYYRAWLANSQVSITPRMMCAGFVAGGYDACQGDSGGPLMVDGYVAGIVSWGNGCAFAGFPGVYASVPNLLPWIKEHTGIL